MICETLAILASSNANHELIVADPRVIEFLLQKLMLASEVGDKSLSALAALATNPDVAMRAKLQVAA